jgi:4-hydroxy 2-oxovalerate aldolase
MQKVMDVTLRDGLYLKSFNFTCSKAISIINAIADTGFEFIEIGYFRRRNKNFSNEKGPIVCDKEYLAALDSLRHNQFAVMVRPGDTEIVDYEELLGTGVQLIRFPCSPQNFKEVKTHIIKVKKLGFKVALNLTRASELTLLTIAELGKSAEDLGADWFYVADSNGSLFPDQVARIFNILNHTISLKLGFHPHDGLSMAFANTIAAFKEGVTLVDATLGGAGKGGNLSSELIAMYLNKNALGNFDVPQILQATANFIAPWFGNHCITRNENAAASILNCNLDKLEQYSEEAEIKAEPLWAVLAKNLIILNA